MSYADLETLKDAGVKHYQHADSTLRAKGVELKQRLLDPSLHKVSSHYEGQPALTSLLGLFFALAALPILFFIGFSLLAILTVGGSALAFSLVVLSSVIGIAALFLFGALAIAACTAATCCFWGILAVAAFKLVLHLAHASDLPSGLKAFQRDMQTLLLGKGKEGKSVSFELNETVKTVKTEGATE